MRVEPSRDNAAMRLAALAICLLLASCASQQVVERFDLVSQGMTKDEVIDLLGAPSSSWSLVRAQDGVDGERLQWGDGLSSMASSAAFQGDPDRAYSVVFDAQGRVLSKATPQWVEMENAETEALRGRRRKRVGDW